MISGVVGRPIWHLVVLIDNPVFVYIPVFNITTLGKRRAKCLERRIGCFLIVYEQSFSDITKRLVDGLARLETPGILVLRLFIMAVLAGSNGKIAKHGSPEVFRNVLPVIHVKIQSLRISGTNVRLDRRFQPTGHRYITAGL